MNLTISLAIPTFNSSPYILQTFAEVIDDERISEIIINDDASADFELLKNKIEQLKSPKIKLYQNSNNLKAYKNKATAISKCNNDWIVLLDSDNAIDSSYIDTLFSNQWDETVILCPEFAKPLHDYRRFSDLVVDRSNIKKMFLKDKFAAFLNTGNFFFNKTYYLKVYNNIEFDEYLSILDAIYFTSYWINAGYKLKLCSGLNYFHRNRGDSFFMENKHVSNDINQKIAKFIVGVELIQSKPKGMFRIIINKIKSLYHLSRYYLYEKYYFFLRKKTKHS